VLHEYFSEAFSTYLDAEQDGYAEERFYTVAHYSVQVRFARPALVDVLSPALEHLRSEPVSVTALTVCIWDDVSTKKRIPAFPWKDKASITQFVEGTNPVICFKDDRFLGAYHIGTKMLSMLDTQQNTAILWVPDADKIPYYERSSPLRIIFQWWAKKRGLQLVHAGAVGINRTGVLLAGEGGSGKSTTAINCLNAGLSYVSDDYCLVGMESDPYAHSIYCSAKIGWNDLQRFPKFASAVDRSDDNHEDKALLILNKQYHQKIVRGFSIRAILVPRIAGSAKTIVTPISARQGLMALAPSTIFQLRGAGQRDLSFIAELTRIIPSFLLELGTDYNNIPDIVLNVLKSFNEN